MTAINTMHIFSWINTCTIYLSRVKMLMVNLEGYLQREKNKKGEFARNKYRHMPKEDRMCDDVR